MVGMAEKETTTYAKGFRFDPFDQELINDYLKPLVVEKQNPCDFIQLRDVYGPCSNPWFIFPEDDQSWFRSPHLKNTEKCMFVFSKLSKVSKSAGSKKAGSRKGGCGGNTKKKVGWGTWDGKSTRKQIRDDEGNVIGEHRYLVFELNEIDSGVIGCDWRKVGLYRMHEYSLSGINAGLDSADIIVLCKITYDSTKACPVDLKSGAKLAGDVTSISSEVDEKEVIINAVCSEPAENISANAIVGVDDFSTATQDMDAFDADIESLSPEDMHWIMEYLNSNLQNEPIEENSMSYLGKRKSEAEEDSLTNKKACVF